MKHGGRNYVEQGLTRHVMYPLGNRWFFPPVVAYSAPCRCAWIDDEPVIICPLHQDLPVQLELFERPWQSGDAPVF